MHLSRQSKQFLEMSLFNTQRQTTADNRNTAQSHSQRGPNRAKSPMIIDHDNITSNDFFPVPINNWIQDTRCNRDKNNIVNDRPAEIHLDTVEDSPAEEDELEDGVQV